jgi:signal transduction histidine kinase
MRVCLLTSNKKLRDFVSEVVGTDMLGVGDKPTEAELCVYDFEPGGGLPSFSAEGSWSHLFLVDPQHLADFSNLVQSRPVCLLLKPVTRPALEAFLDSFRELSASKSNHHRETASLRSDRDELLQHLLQANLRLQQYDQERTNFLARALHDLRTPLTSLRGICGLLLEGEVGPLNPRQRELLQRLQSSAGRLGRMSSGMFELSVQGRVHRTPQLESGDIENCVNRALQEVCSLVQEKQLHVVSHLLPAPMPMFMESQQIEQLLINLLENACKFTPRMGKIDIHGKAISWDFTRSAVQADAEFPNAYRIDIRDSGPGIEPAMLEAIFEQYTSLGAGDDRSRCGLGLAICKLAATAHGGRIWASSSPDGATFSFVLPFDPRLADGRFRHLNEEGRPRSARAV